MTTEPNCTEMSEIELYALFPVRFCSEKCFFFSRIFFVSSTVLFGKVNVSGSPSWGTEHAVPPPLDSSCHPRHPPRYMSVPCVFPVCSDVYLPLVVTRAFLNGVYIVCVCVCVCVCVVCVCVCVIACLRVFRI